MLTWKISVYRKEREIPSAGIAQDMPITRYNVMTQGYVFILVSDDRINHKDKTSTGCTPHVYMVSGGSKHATATLYGQTFLTLVWEEMGIVKHNTCKDKTQSTRQSITESIAFFLIRKWFYFDENCDLVWLVAYSLMQNIITK